MRLPKTLSIFLAAATVLLMTGLAYARLTRTDIVELIDDFRRQEEATFNQRIPQLREEFVKQKDPRKKMAAALGLGIAHLQDKNWRTSLQYLSIADHMSSADDLMHSIIAAYLASVHFELGNYQETIAYAERAKKLGPGRERHKQALELIINAYFNLGLHKRVIETYREYAKHYSHRTALHLANKLAAISYQALGRQKEEIDLLETLSEQYPLSDEAIWAFNRLIDYNCVIDNKRIYYFSQRLLRKLGINRSLATGVEEFLISQSYLPIRDLKNQVRVLDTLERIDLLLTLNLSKAAASYIDYLTDTLRTATGEDQKNATMLLARANFDNQKFTEAARYYHLYSLNYPRDRETVKALEGLAASQMALGAYKAAAINFEKLVKNYGQRAFTWEQFWAVYLSKDYEAALAMLNIKNYVKIKDPQEPLTLNYWRGRVLQKLGRQAEADQEYRYILQTDGTSYYANLVLSHSPSFWAEFVPEEGSEQPKAQIDPQSKPGILLASIDFSYYPSPHTPQTEVEQIQDLIAAGLFRDAGEILEKIRVGNNASEQEIDTVEGLAYYLADFRAYRRIALESFKDFQRFPKNLRDLAEHQKTYRDQWRAIFPLAFDKILTRVESIVKVDRLLLLSLMRTESRFDVYAKSWVGARGLMQIMPKTALRISELVKNRGFDLPELYEPSVNIGYGGYYFRRLFDYYGSNLFLAIAAYNAGPIAANRWFGLYGKCETDEFVELITYRETRRYVKEVVKYFGLYKKIYTNGNPYLDIPSLPSKLPENEDLF